MRPLTIKQILDAEEPYPDAGHQVDGVTISQVRAPDFYHTTLAQKANVVRSPWSDKFATSAHKPPTLLTRSTTGLVS